MTKLISGSASYLQAVEARRSHYALSAESPITDAALQAIVEEAVKHTPSAYNSQSGRAVLVLGSAHKQLWQAVLDAHLKTLDPSRAERTKANFEVSFAAGYGTVVFFEDQETIERLQQIAPDYDELSPIWSHNSAGILQHVVWTALEAEGLGASLQHFGQASKDTEEDIKRVLQVPSAWTSTALLPFGVSTAEPGEKNFKPISERVLVRGGE